MKYKAGTKERKHKANCKMLKRLLPGNIIEYYYPPTFWRQQIPKDIHRDGELRVSKSGKVYLNYYKRKTKSNPISLRGNKKLCLERDNYTCQICGGKEHIDIHHKDYHSPYIPPSPDNSLRNLVTLCHQCHIKLHCSVSSKHEEIIRLRSEGRTLQSIGDIYQVSRQRIFQIIKKINPAQS